MTICMAEFIAHSKHTDKSLRQIKKEFPLLDVMPSLYTFLVETENQLSFLYTFFSSQSNIFIDELGSFSGWGAVQ